MEFWIICAVLLLWYLFIRKYGKVDGTTIKVQLPPASTPEGKRGRLVAATGSALSLMAVSFIAVHQQEQSNNGVAEIVIPFLTGIMAFMLFYIARNRD